MPLATVADFAGMTDSGSELSLAPLAARLLVTVVSAGVGADVGSGVSFARAPSILWYCLSGQLRLCRSEF